MDKKLDAIQKQITQTETELKEHNYNVISLAMLGNKNDTVRDINNTINFLLGDIRNPENTSMTEEQKIQALADMYNNSEFYYYLAAGAQEYTE